MTQDTLSILTEIVLNFVVYGLLANLFVMIASEFAGDRLRFKARFWRRRLVKWLRNIRIELVAVLKPADFRVAESVQDVRGKLQRVLLGRGIRTAIQDSSLTFEIKNAHTSAVGEVSLSFEIPDHVEGVQVSVRLSVEYQRFSDGFINLVDAIGLLEDSIREAYPSVVSYLEVLQCLGVKKAYELNGVLRQHQLEVLSSRRKDGIQLDFGPEQITLYGRMDAALKNLLQDLITYYY